MSTRSLHLLIDDVASQPVLSRPCQDLWLGLQLRGPERLRRVCARVGLQADDPAARSLALEAVYETVLEQLRGLEEGCAAEEIEVPAAEAWVTEALVARQSIHGLLRSRLWRFVAGLQRSPTGRPRSALANTAIGIGELLCLLPLGFLEELAPRVRASEAMPGVQEAAGMLARLTPGGILSESAEQQARRARDLLVTGYMRFVLRLARRYIDRGLDFADLAQEGFLGLIRAAEHYDCRVQTRFGTYAMSWIWQAIERALAEQARVIRLPVHVAESLRQLESARAKLAGECAGEPTATQLAGELGLLAPQEVELLNAAESSRRAVPEGVAARRIRALKRLARLASAERSVLSLEAAVGDGVDAEGFRLEAGCWEPGCRLSDIVRASTFGSSLDDHLDVFAQQDALAGSLKRLSQRERLVLELRFGQQDGVERTLEEIGARLHLTRERVRQIQARALEKLRDRRHGEPLRAWLGTGVVSTTGLAELPPEALTQIDRSLRLREQPSLDGPSTGWAWLDELLARLPGASRPLQSPDGVDRKGQLINCLRALGGPAHYCEITEQLNGLLGEEGLEESHIYGLLARWEETFILLGEGVFSLVEWERMRAAEPAPSVPVCPGPLPDPPGQEAAFFESVMVAASRLAQRPAASEFVSAMLEWAGVAAAPQRWYSQSILVAYYLVGVVPYVFCYDGHNPSIDCILPQRDVQSLRRYCLQRLTDRLVCMPEFWFVLQRRQPARAAVLGRQLADVHPLGLDDAGNRLAMLTAFGATRRRADGCYHLTEFGETLACDWGRRPSLPAEREDTAARPVDPRLALEPPDIAVW